MKKTKLAMALLILTFTFLPVETVYACVDIIKINKKAPYYPAKIEVVLNNTCKDKAIKVEVTYMYSTDGNYWFHEKSQWVTIPKGGNDTVRVDYTKAPHEKVVAKDNTSQIDIFTLKVTFPQGGEAIPIDKPIIKPESPTLWIWLSAIVLPIVATAIHVKRAKRKKKKQ